MIDSHCHLDHEPLFNQIYDVLDRSKKEGITKCKWFTLDELVLTLKDSRPLIHYLIGFVLNDPRYKNYRKNKKK